MSDAIVSPTPESDVELAFEGALRPRSLGEFVGQAKVRGQLQLLLQAAAIQSRTPDHILLSGPPGLGKTTLAKILAEERGSALHETTGPAIEHKGQLAALLTRIQANDVVFIDEIHRLTPIVEENLYTAVEDFCIDIVNGDGPYAQILKLPLPPFTLVGATTRTGLLTNPMLSRFGYVARLDYYDLEALTSIVSVSSPSVTESVDRPTGPPPNLWAIAARSSRSTRSRPTSSTSSSSRASRATSSVTTPAWRTSATSRTRRRIRLAMRGVPRERLAISSAASSSISTPRMPAERTTIDASSPGS